MTDQSHRPDRSLSDHVLAALDITVLEWNEESGTFQLQGVPPE